MVFDGSDNISELNKEKSTFIFLRCFMIFYCNYLSQKSELVKFVVAREAENKRQIVSMEGVSICRC